MIKNKPYTILSVDYFIKQFKNNTWYLKCNVWYLTFKAGSESTLEHDAVRSICT